MFCSMLQAGQMKNQNIKFQNSMNIPNCCVSANSTYLSEKHWEIIMVRYSYKNYSQEDVDRFVFIQVQNVLHLENQLAM